MYNKIIDMDNTFNKIISLKNEGKTTSEICDILGVSKGTIGYHLGVAKKQGIEYLKQTPNKNHSIERKKEIKLKKQKTCNNKILKEDFENLSFERLKKRVLMEQEGKCNKCGISEWFGISLSLELEHKDGNNQNNNRENLEVICPNCHSITDTWKGRNIINKKNKIDDDKLYEALKLYDFNIWRALISLHMSPKGSNYNRAYKLINKMLL